MTLSDWINAILCILSFLLAAMSIIFVIITLKQNNKMIEAESRPYINVYGEQVNFSSLQYYLVIKNFGKSGGLIEKMECSIDLKKYTYVKDINPFATIKGTMIAPNQNFVCAIDYQKLSDDEIKSFDFDIVYSFSGKKYEEKYTINYEAHRKNVTMKSSTSDKEIKTISYVLQEMVQKDL